MGVGGGRVWGVGLGGGGQGGCEWRSEASVKIQKKNYFFWGGMGAWVGGGGVRVGGVRVDGNRSEACLKIQKKNFFFFFWGGGVGSGGGVRVGGSGWMWMEK